MQILYAIVNLLCIVWLWQLAWLIGHGTSERGIGHFWKSFGISCATSAGIKVLGGMLSDARTPIESALLNGLLTGLGGMLFLGAAVGAIAWCLGRLSRSPGDKVDALVEKHMGSLFRSLQQRPKWRHITAETLAAIPDDELEIAIFDIVWALPIKSLDQSLTALSELGIGYQTVYTTLQLETEVDNGGFQQYFHNSTRHYFPMAREGYQRLGLTNLVQIADAAKAAYDEELAMDPPQAETPDDQLDEFMSRYEDSKVDSATDQFYAEKKAALAARTTYIRLHPDQFFGDFRDRYK